MTRIYETQNYLMIHAAYRAPSCHSHQAAHILLGLEDTIAVTLNGEKQLCRGILIPPGISHTVDTAGKPVLVFLFDSRTSAAKQICNVRILPEQDCITLVQRYGAFCEDSCTYRQFERDLLEMLGMSQVISCVTDCRIAEALDYMRTRLSEPLTCRETAAAVCLSESRFSHLFRQQVGMTFAAYRIFQRLMHVYGVVIGGSSLTEAALDAGFSSSAHFADVNSRIFGLPASCVTKELIFRKID